MNQSQVSVLLILQELGIKYQMESLVDRLIVQKGIYLAQAAGIDLGHYFNWYLRGPYSPNLTGDVFDATQNYDAAAVIKRWELDATTRTKLAKLRACLAPPPSLDQSVWLEFMASVYFLIDRRQVPAADPDLLISQLAKYGKAFTRSQAVEALRRLRAIVMGAGQPAHPLYLPGDIEPFELGG